MVNPGSGINTFIMEFPGFENSRQWPQKAKVMTKIRKTKRAICFSYCFIVCTGASLVSSTVSMHVIG